MPRKRINKKEKNILDKIIIKKENKKKVTKIDDNVISIDEKKNLKNLILLLEEHERIQLYHFIIMDNIKHTKISDGILLNLKNTNDEFITKIHSFIHKCMDNQKYRSLT